MQRPSLYGAFGDKRELYLATLDRYVESSRDAMRAALCEGVPIAAALERVYDLALALYFADPKAPLGCFLIGTAASEAARDARVRDRLGSGLRELTRTFEARFRAAQERGELGKQIAPSVLADLAGAGAALDRAARARWRLALVAARVLARGGQVAMRHEGGEDRATGEAPAIARAGIRKGIGSDLRPPTKFVSERRASTARSSRIDAAQARSAWLEQRRFVS